ncbi:MAG: hypothetical protein IJH91_07005 [Mogibacterium sp.]|nr:hypothetical protein [Mogibacterium sp.]
MAKKFFKTLPITLIVVVVLLALIILQSLTGTSTWSYIFCLFYYTTFCGMKLDKVLPVSIWGFLGFLGGYITPFIGGTAGTIVLLIYLILLLNISLSGVFKSFDPATFLFLTLTTAVTGLCTKESFVKDLGGYICGVILMLAIGLIASAVGKKAAAKAAAKEAAAAEEGKEEVVEEKAE